MCRLKLFDKKPHLLLRMRATHDEAPRGTRAEEEARLLGLFQEHKLTVTVRPFGSDGLPSSDTDPIAVGAIALDARWKPRD